jgi:hypothetical protein
MLRRELDLARVTGRGFLQAVASGSVSGTIFESRRTDQHVWIITVIKADGNGLTQHEVRSIESEDLLRQTYSDVTIKIVDGQGRQFEEWQWEWMEQEGLLRKGWLSAA